MFAGLSARDVSLLAPQRVNSKLTVDTQQSLEQQQTHGHTDEIPDHVEPNGSSSQINRRRAGTQSHKRYAFVDPVAFRYLEEDPCHQCARTQSTTAGLRGLSRGAMGLFTKCTHLHHLHIHWGHVPFDRGQRAWGAYRRENVVDQIEDLFQCRGPVLCSRARNFVRNSDGHEPQQHPILPHRDPHS